MFVPTIFRNRTFVRLRACVRVAMLGVFRVGEARMEETRDGAGMCRKMEGERAARIAGAEFARARLLWRVMARLPWRSHRVADHGLLFRPVTIPGKPRFAWRFRAITGEIFFARKGSPRGGNAGSQARISAGRGSLFREAKRLNLHEISERKFFARNPAPEANPGSSRRTIAMGRLSIATAFQPRCSMCWNCTMRNSRTDMRKVRARIRGRWE